LLDAFGAVVASAVDELNAALVPNFHVVEHRVRFAQVFLDHFAVRREDDHSFIGADEDISALVNRDSAVRRSQGRAAVGTKPPAWHRIEGHQAAAHANGLNLVSR
jgi:hypothetical protein